MQRIAKTNPRLSWWGPKSDLFGEVVMFQCPTSLTFDSTVFTMDSHCPMFSYDGEVDFTFDSTLYLMSSTFEASMDMETT